MGRLVRSGAALGAVFFAAIGIAACGGIPGNAVVQVNGTPIAKSTFNHWMNVAVATSAGAAGSKSKPVVPDPPSYKECIAHLRSTQPKPEKGQKPPSESQLKAQCEQQYTALKDQVLAYLISTEWVLGEAEEQKISVSKKEVEKELNTLKKAKYPKEKEFKAFLASTGYTISDLLLRVKVEMISRKLQEKVTNEAKKKAVTKADVKKYYEEHESQYGQPERRNLNIILTKTEAAASKAKSEIEGGQSFASVAKRVSIDPTSKAKGGSLPNVAKSEEEKALGEAVFSAKTGVLSGPVKTPFGYYVFEVTKVLPASHESLSKVESTIKQQLTAERQQKAFAEFVKKFRKKWTARTECRAEYTVEDCKGYKKPKTTTTPAAPPSTSTETSVSTSATTSSTKSK